MPRITLERTLKTSFVDMSYAQKEAPIKAFRDYNRRVRLLGETGRLGVEDLLELIDSGQEDRSATMVDVAALALAERSDGVQLFEPGSSAVMVAGGGRLIGAYDNPNPDPTLQSYGPGLMWALLKIGQERYAATTVCSSANLAEGYGSVNQALTGKLLEEVAYSERQHIGGSAAPRYLNPGSTSMRALEYELLFCGVSGILARNEFRSLATEFPYLRHIASEAHSSGATAGFDGNLYAGSLDSTMASRMLGAVVGDQICETSFTERALGDIQSRHLSGINVH